MKKPSSLVVLFTTLGFTVTLLLAEGCGKKSEDLCERAYNKAISCQTDPTILAKAKASRTEDIKACEDRVSKASSECLDASEKLLDCVIALSCDEYNGENNGATACQNEKSATDKACPDDTSSMKILAR